MLRAESRGNVPLRLEFERQRSTREKNGPERKYELLLGHAAAEVVHPDRHDLEDLRPLFEGDVRFSSAFGAEI